MKGSAGGFQGGGFQKSDENASVRHEKASRKCSLTLAMMNLGSRRGGATGPLLQSMGLRKMRHLVHVVGFACWEVLALGHGARGSEEQV